MRAIELSNSERVRETPDIASRGSAARDDSAIATTAATAAKAVGRSAVGHEVARPARGQMGMPSDVHIKARTPDPQKHSALGRRASLTPDMRREGGGVAVLRRLDESPASQRRRQSMPELPPIGAKPNSPGYGGPPAYANGQATADKRGGSDARKRPPPLSPASSAASLTTSLTRNNSFMASDLSNSMHSARLETLFEGLDSRGGGATPRTVAATTTDANGTAQDGRKAVVWSLGDAAMPSKPPISRSKLDTSLGSLKSRSPLDDNRNVVVATPRIGPTAATIAPSLTPHPPPQQQSAPPQAASTATSTLTSRLSQENLNSLQRVQGGGGGGGSPDGYDSDREKDERIMEWLTAVTSSAAAQGTANMPPPPDISPIETEEKRDTAIHIIYNGD